MLSTIEQQNLNQAISQAFPAGKRRFGLRAFRRGFEEGGKYAKLSPYQWPDAGRYGNLLIAYHRRWEAGRQAYLAMEAQRLDLLINLEVNFLEKHLNSSALASELTCVTLATMFGWQPDSATLPPTRVTAAREFLRQTVIPQLHSRRPELIK